MSIAVMSLIISAILSLTDVLSYTKRVFGLTGAGCAYFAVCVLALGIFDVSIVDQMTLNAGCAVLLLCICSAFASGAQKCKLLAVPLSLLFAAAGYILDRIAPKLSIYLLGMLYSVLLIRWMEPGAFAVAALAPVFTELASFIIEYTATGYSDIELAGAVFDKQCFALLAIALSLELKHAFISAVERKRRPKET